MNTQLTKADPNQQYQLSDDDVKTLVAVGVIPAGTTPDVITFFAKTCATMQLSPFKKQIHLIKRQALVKKRDPNRNNAIMEVWEPRYSIQTGIDGYRSRAASTGQYAGNDDYLFDDGKTEYQMIEAERPQPKTATATVYKLMGGVRCPFTASARWTEYCPKEKESFMWMKMPFLMLGKTAEALALRKAFPNETSGAMVDEEMEHLGEVEQTMIDAPAKTPEAMFAKRATAKPEVTVPPAEVMATTPPPTTPPPTTAPPATPPPPPPPAKPEPSLASKIRGEMLEANVSFEGLVAAVKAMRFALDADDWKGWPDVPDGVFESFAKAPPKIMKQLITKFGTKKGNS